MSEIRAKELDETQPVTPVDVTCLGEPIFFGACDADKPINANIVDGYFDSVVSLTITVDDRGIVRLVGYDWGQSVVTPGRYTVALALDPV